MSKFSIRAAYWQHRDDLSSIIIQPPSIDFEDVAKEMRNSLAVKGFSVNKSAKISIEIFNFYTWTRIMLAHNCGCDPRPCGHRVEA